MNKLKRTLSFVLCLVMLLGMIPGTAFAAVADSDDAVSNPPEVVDSIVEAEDTADTAGTNAASPMAATGAVQVEHNGDTTYYANLQKAFDGFAPSNNTYGGKYVVTLLADIEGMTAVKNFQYPTEVLDITLDLNGHTITGDGAHIAVNINMGSSASNISSGSFTIKDSSGNNSGKITGGKGGVYVYGKNATLNFQGGTITGNHGASKGGGIMVGATTFFNMTGGVITGNSVTGTSSANTGLGGGVLVNYGSITGGVITGNEAKGGTGKQTGRGGGVCTEITRTKGYSTLTISNGVVYGNTAENAGDDLMAQGNGMSTTKWSLSIGTENWYIDGWNGTKATAGNGEVARYSAENPVAYTDGGFTDTYNKSLGLKYVAPAAPADPPPEEPKPSNVSGHACVFRCNNSDVDHQAIGLGFDSVYSEAGEIFKNEATGEWAVEVTTNIRAYWEEHGSGLYEDLYSEYAHTPQVELPEALIDTLTWNAEKEKWEYDEDVVTYDISCPKAPEAPDAPYADGSNVTSELITIICDSDEGHTAKTYGWGDPAANIVYPTGSEPVWDDELDAWTIGVRIDSIGTYYVGLQFNKEHNKIQHDIVKGAPLTSDEYSRIDTTLVWDAEKAVWTTLTGEPFEVHTTCQTKPEAPSMGYHLNKFQIKVVGEVDGVESVWFSTLDADSVTVGEVKGNRTDGFTVDVTVALADGDSYISAWLAKHAPDAEAGSYVYNWEKTASSVTFAMKYIGDTTGEIRDGSEYWAPDGDRVYTAYVDEVRTAPAAPDKFGDNVTPELVKVICDTDHNHTALCIKWQHQSTEVRDWVSGVVWSDEYNTWVVPVRIDGVINYYVWLNFEKVYNDIKHELVNEDQKCIDTYLKWDAAKQLWVTLDEKPIEVHVTCKTAPDAPTTLPSSFQIQVKGDLDHDGIFGENKSNCALGVSELRAVTIPDGGYTLSKVYGSREEGFFVDVTVTLENGDTYITTWIENCAPGRDFVYDWDQTKQTVTFTLKYNRSTTGTLQGSNKSDWAANFTGYKVGEAFVIPSKPAAPKQDNVTAELVTVICDSDGNRHTPVTGKWYPTHCDVLSTSEITWNKELNAWTVDVRIGGLYIMYVDQLEEANGGTEHTLVEDITTVYTTLKWDGLKGLWFPVKPIELHTTCKTAPSAPVYKQLESYQVKVHGMADGKEVVWTTSIPENGYTMSEVYGSREEGFFVDITFTLADGDIYQQNWLAERAADAPEGAYSYDWDKTEQTVTFTLKYNGNLNGTLHGDRHSNTGYDWVLENGKTYGVVSDAYVKGSTFTIVYRYWLGTNMGTHTQTGTYGEGLTLRLNTFTRKGYTFDHWNSKRDTDDGKFNFTDGETLDAKTVNELYNYAMSNGGKAYLNAYWKANTFTIVYRYWLGTTMGSYTQTATYDQELTLLPNTFTRYGYTFDHWNSMRDTDDGKFTFADKETVSAEVVNELYDYAMDNGGKAYLNAYWKGNKFTIVYRYWLGTTMGTYTQTATYGEELTLRANTFTRKGYTFDHWNSKRDTDDGKFTFADKETVTAEVVNKLYDYAMDNGGKAYLNAYWKANQYTLTLDPTGGKVSPATITVTYDSAIGELPEATRVGYIFDGWVDAQGNEVTAETIYTVADDSTISAQWIQHPGSGSQNVTNELFTIQCTEKHEHSWLCNWFGSHVSLVKDSVKWNAELGRWEAQAKIGSSMLSMINSTQPRKNYFGNQKHYYDQTNYVFDLYYDPGFTGLNSQKEEVTGMWLPVEKYVVDVYCYNEPSMPNLSKITSTVLWVRDISNTKTTHSQKFTVKQLIADTYTLGEMYTKDGKFYVDLTITDLTAYIEKLETKTGKDYVLPEWAHHYSNGDFKFTLVYTPKSNPIDYAQDGTGWSVDASSWASNSEKNNGKSLWLTEQFTVTYTDGAEGKVFADQSFTVNGHYENGATRNAATDFTATATPTIEVPERIGYKFLGWTPAWSETVTGDVTYTAQWELIHYNITVNANEGGTVEVQDTAVYDELVSVNITPNTGYKVVKAEAVYQGKNGNVTINLMNGNKFFMPASDITIIVEFEQVIYSITVDADEHGTVEVQDSSVYGVVVPMTITPNTGYSVASVKVVYQGKYGQVTTTVNNYTRFMMPAADVTLVVRFAPNTYNVTLDANGGTVEPSTLSATFDSVYGELPVPTREGHTFAGWTLNGEPVTAETVVATAEDHTLVAQWTVNKYMVTLDANGGAVEPTTITVTYDAKVGELPVPSRVGYTFTGWLDSNGIPVTAETLYTVAGDSTWVATWRINKYVVTFNANGGLPVAPQVVEYGSTATMVYTTYPNKTLDCWTLNGQKFDFSTPITGDITLVAVWRDPWTFFSPWTTIISAPSIVAGNPTVVSFTPFMSAFR